MKKNDSAKGKIFKIAEGLFFEKGYDGVSTRDITEKAGVNVAAISYYFKGKKNLYREVLRKRLAPIGEKRVSALKEVISGKEKPDLREVIRVFVSEFLGDTVSSKEAMNFLNLIHSEVSSKGVAVDVLIKEVIAPVQGLMKEAILKARPDFTEEKAALCCMSITGQTFQLVRGRPIIKQMMGQVYDKEFIEKAIEHIVDFSLKGIMR